MSKERKFIFFIVLPIVLVSVLLISTIPLYKRDSTGLTNQQLVAVMKAQPSTNGSLSITVDTDHPKYAIGEPISISGTISDESGLTNGVKVSLRVYRYSDL